MSAKLKPIQEQVVVITGASSGIGLATAIAFAKRGAKVVLSARSDEVLSHVVQQISDAGGTAIAIHCDVSQREEVIRLAETTIQHFGRIDTWVNNAGLGMYGRLDEVSDEDNRRLFDINFWGVVYGSLAALPHMKAAGGAIINVGSEVSDAYPPLLGMYAASKHAVKGFTDALRVEIEEVDKAPIAITLVQPSATDTPFPQNARNYQDKEAKLPDPQDKPENVAEAIVSAAEKQQRYVRPGPTSFMNTVMAKFAPSVADKLTATYVEKQHYEEPPRDPAGAFHKPSQTGRIHGTGGVEKSPPSSQQHH